MGDIKNQDPAAASSGVSGGIIGAIRKTSDAFLHSIHLIPAAPQQEQAQTNMPSMPATEESAAQKERRMSDIEHLWESSRKIHGF